MPNSIGYMQGHSWHNQCFCEYLSWIQGLSHVGPELPEVVYEAPALVWRLQIGKFLK